MFAQAKSQERGSEAPPNSSKGNIHTQTLKEYVESFYFLRVRLKFLGWEVDVELLEVFAGLGIWIVLSDMVNVVEASPLNNGVYQLAFKLMPHLSWIIIAASIGLIHLVAILLDRSSEPGFDVNEDKAVHLRVRVTAMAFTFLFDIAITASIFAAYTYALSWKLMATFTLAAFFSHIRLRQYHTKLMKVKGKQKESVINTC